MRSPYWARAKSATLQRRHHERGFDGAVTGFDVDTGAGVGGLAHVSSWSIPNVAAAEPGMWIG